MRFLAFLEYAAVIVGALGIIASQYFYLPKGVHLGLVVVGAGFTLGGLESLFTRRMSFRFASHAGEGYAGAPALIWAGMALLIGAAFIASGYLMEQGLWRGTVNELVRRPAPLLAGAGLLLAGTGALLIFNPGRQGIAWTILVRVPKTFFGVLLVGAGVVGLALGALEWFEPQAYGLIVKRARELFDFRAIERFWRSPFGFRV